MSVRVLTTLSRLAVLLGFLVVAVLLGYFAGPMIEGRLFPIIRDMDRGNVSSDPDGHTCWDTGMEKVRPGMPVYALYTTIMHDRPVSIFVYLAKDGTPLTQPGFQNHEPGSKWITRYCTDLPAQLRERPIRIDGTLYHQVAWRPTWWRIPQALPSLGIPAAE